MSRAGVLLHVHERFAHHGEQGFGNLRRQRPLLAEQHQVCLQSSALAEGAHDCPQGLLQATVLKVGTSFGTGPTDLGSFGGTMTGAGTLQKQDLGTFTLTSTHSFG